jgi:hypothetical protein
MGENEQLLELLTALLVLPDSTAPPVPDDVPDDAPEAPTVAPLEEPELVDTPVAAMLPEVTPAPVLANVPPLATEPLLPDELVAPLPALAPLDPGAASTAPSTATAPPPSSLPPVPASTALVATPVAPQKTSQFVSVPLLTKTLASVFVADGVSVTPVMVWPVVSTC